MQSVLDTEERRGMNMSKVYKAHCQYGYYLEDCLVRVDRGLKDHPYSQCGIIRKEDAILFVSYETIVCEIDNDGYFNLRGEFSTTTSKQISWFLYEWCRDYSHRHDLCSYSFLRDKYRKGIDVNLWNGDERKHIDGMIQTIGVEA